MIPKKIHYCWFGNAEKSDLIKSCISSWGIIGEGFEIIEWNEKTFPIARIDNQFFNEALKNKKWAFVSDYVRLWVLKEYGGIYLDTDVEVIKPFTDVIDTDCFIGFENSYTLGSCVIGARSEHPFIIDCLQNYDYINYNNLPNVVYLTKIAENYGLLLNNKEQQLKNGLMVYPIDYFTTKNYITGAINKTENSLSIHHFEGSWLGKDRKKSKIKKWLVNILGDKLFKGILIRKREKKFREVYRGKK